MQIELTPAQKLNISGRMIQSSEILQMSLPELGQYLEQLALENPLMELESPPVEYEHTVQLSYAQDDQNPIYDRQDRKDALDPWNRGTDMTETLEDSLFFQLNDLSLTDRQRHIMEYMILNLETSGYLEMSLDEIADETESDPDELLTLLSLLQTLEPDGIGARSLPECLCIQLKKQYPEDRVAYAIASQHLELVAKNQMTILARRLQVSLEEVLRACRVIRSLNPKPGSCYGDRKYVSYIRPELAVVKFSDHYDIVLNDSLLPPIRYNEEYMRMLTDSSGQVSDYLSEKKRQLDWISQCVARRNETLLSLGKLIVQKQQSFFLHGAGHLKSFSQAEAASALQIHESAVSRAVKDKFLQCTYGVFPLSYFFVQGLDERDRIRGRIRELIDAEDKNRPLSDQALANLLEQEHLKVSKRLVTKYRNEMRIPDSARRRRYNL